MKNDLSPFLKSSETSLIQIFETLQKAPSLSLQSLEADQTALIIVDMVNGFV